MDGFSQSRDSNNQQNSDTFATVADNAGSNSNVSPTVGDVSGTVADNGGDGDIVSGPASDMSGKPDVTSGTPPIDVAVEDDPATDGDGGHPRKTKTKFHTLTVREVVAKFRASGVPRSSRSITRWCRPGPDGVAYLDGYYDRSRNMYFITPESVENAIAEEKAKEEKRRERVRLEDVSATVADNAGSNSNVSPTVGDVSATVGDSGRGDDGIAGDDGRIDNVKILELEREAGRLKEDVRDLERKLQKKELDNKLNEGLVLHYMKKEEQLLDKLEARNYLLGEAVGEVRKTNPDYLPRIPEYITAERKSIAPETERIDEKEGKD